MSYTQPEGILDSGKLVMSGAWQAIGPDNPNFYRQFTFRLQTSGTTIEWSVKDENGTIKGGPHLKADESWTLGPDAGSITPKQIYVKGTSGETLGWDGILV